MINTIQSIPNQQVSEFQSFIDLEKGSVLENPESKLGSKGLFSLYGGLSSIGILRFLFEGTLFHVLEPGRLKREKKKIRKWSFGQKILKGAWLGTKWNGAQFLMICIPLFLRKRAFKFAVLGEEEKFFLFLGIVVGPFFEELVFRFFVQNAIYLCQVGIKYSHFGKDNREKVSWITSPSARILLEGSLFAFVHVFSKNEKIHFSSVDSLRNAEEIAFYPAYSILYYLTGSIYPGIVAHSINNMIAYSFDYIKAS